MTSEFLNFSAVMDRFVMVEFIFEMRGIVVGEDILEDPVDLDVDVVLVFEL